MIEHRAAPQHLRLVASTQAQAPTDHVARAIAAAKRGAQHPALLTPDEIRLVCRALAVHFAQMGIG